MNLQLLDPFEQNFPEVIEDTLEEGQAVTVKFNRRGTLLAAGCSDGTIVVWDFDTRGVSRSLVGHVKTITSLSWSRNGRYLLSASKDWSCIVWDLLTGTKLHTVRFDTSVLNAQFHPKNSSIFIVALHQGKPLLIDISDGVKRLPILEEANEDNSEKTEPASRGGQIPSTLVVTFDRLGKKIYAGTNRGHLRIVDTESRTLLYETRPTTSAIKSIQFSRRGREIVINSNDRVIRLLATRENGPPEQQHKFQDLVNRIQWNQCCLSSDADYVIGGSAHQAEHNIYIWDRIGGNLVKILEGPKEPLEDLAWHPIRPIIASVTSFGTIHIWATNSQENWSAFAPDFKELEENIDYEEREDEFDIVPEEEASKRKHEDEDVVIDVTTIEKINPFNDSDTDDGEEEMFYLPLLPSDHVPEEKQHRKRHSRRSHHTNNNSHNHHHSSKTSTHSNQQQDLSTKKEESLPSPSASTTSTDPNSMHPARLDIKIKDEHQENSSSEHQQQRKRDKQLQRQRQGQKSGAGGDAEWEQSDSAPPARKHPKSDRLDQERDRDRNRQWEREHDHERDLERKDRDRERKAERKQERERERERERDREPSTHSHNGHDRDRDRDQDFKRRRSDDLIPATSKSVKKQR